MSQYVIGNVTLLTMYAFEEAEAVCSRLCLIRSGKIEFLGTATELRRHFHCGYLLKVANTEFDRDGFAQFLGELVEEAREMPRLRGSFVLPVSDGIVRLLDAIDERKGQFGVEGFTHEIQSLEDIVLKMAEADDAPLRAPNAGRWPSFLTL